MKYKADILLEQGQAVLAALLEIWRCTYKFFIHACIAWKRPGTTSIAKVTEKQTIPVQKL